MHHWLNLLSSKSLLARLSKWLVVLILTFSLGAHWMFLQSVAWVGMVVNYSHDASLSEALSKTFDGKHPCCLCKFVQEGKAKEKKQEAQKPLKEIEKSLPADTLLVVVPPPTPALFFNAPLLANSRVETPPTPPPEPA